MLSGLELRDQSGLDVESERSVCRRTQQHVTQPGSENEESASSHGTSLRRVTLDSVLRSCPSGLQQPGPSVSV